MPISNRKKSVGIIVQLGILLLVIVGALNYEAILDDYALATYHPDPQVAAIANKLDLTTEGRAIMYRARPRIDDKQSFNTDCQTKPQELELGCYYEGRIYVLDISNASLAPEMEVVLAHEILHAVWARLPASEHTQLGIQLEQVYSGLHDQSLEQRMAGYAQTEPGEQTNELHSILGTEYGNLPATLEAHYALYFQDRAAIVAAHSAYQSVFNSQLTVLKQEYAQIESDKSQLASLDTEMQTLRTAGSISQYNALIPRQNGMVDDVNSLIAQYNTLKADYNAMAASLDSQAVTDTATNAQ